MLDYPKPFSSVVAFSPFPHGSNLWSASYPQNASQSTYLQILKSICQSSRLSCKSLPLIHYLSTYTECHKEILRFSIMKTTFSVCCLCESIWPFAVVTISDVDIFTKELGENCLSAKHGLHSKSWTNCCQPVTSDRSESTKRCRSGFETGKAAAPR